jgi:hypothetical protein
VVSEKQERGRSVLTGGSDSGTRFEIFSVMKIQVVVFCFLMPCSDVVGYQRFGGSCCLHLHFILSRSSGL